MPNEIIKSKRLKQRENKESLKPQPNPQPKTRNILIQTDGKNFGVVKSECSNLEMATIFQTLYEKIKPVM